MTEKKNNWTIMAVIAILVGLFIVFVAPGLFDTTMDQLILKQSKQATNLSAGPLSRMYIGSLYSGIEMLVGLALIAISAALYAGKKWAWPITMFLLSIPAMVNGYVGLGVVLFLKENDKKTKSAMFWVFTLLGMLGAQGFMLFPHAVRVILKDPAAALLDPAAAVLRRTGPLMFLVFIFAGLAILKLAQRKESGWYLALLTGLMMAIGAFPAHYIRPPSASLVPAGTLAPSIFTSTYWMAGAQGIILVILLLTPFFKNTLFDKE